MHKLNNKGYMLIEIILAVSLAMGIGYFLIELTLKVKNSNDDLLVESLVKTDQGIIYNMIMKDVYKDILANPNIEIDVGNIYDNINIKKVNEEDEKVRYRVEYKGQVVIVTDYAVVGKKTRENNKITIPITVKQLPNENFDVIMYFAQ